ncbi:MAG: hypothetical protein ACI936_001105 [Paraglaciecola sp.]|jgi:hypothetical protein
MYTLKGDLSNENWQANQEFEKTTEADARLLTE